MESSWCMETLWFYLKKKETASMFNTYATTHTYNSLILYETKMP